MRGTIASRTCGVAEIEDAVEQTPLVVAQVAASLRGVDEVAQLVLGVDRGVVVRGAQPEETDGARARPVEQAYRPLEDFVEGVCIGQETASATRSALSSAIVFGASSPMHDVEEGDDGEGDGERDGVERRLGDAPGERRFEQVCDDGLADPAQRERGHRDAELRGGDVGVEVVEQTEQAARAAVAGGGERLDARASDADEGELRGDEEAVGDDQKKDDENADERFHLAKTPEPGEPKSNLLP